MHHRVPVEVTCALRLLFA